MGRTTVVVRACLPFVALLVLVACQRADDHRRGKLEVRIAGVPHVLQHPGLGGEACVEMALRKAGLTGVDQDYIFSLAELDPNAASGCYTAGLARAVEKLGFAEPLVQRRVATPAALNAQWRALLEDLVTGVPSVVCSSNGTSRRFSLVLGYSSSSGEVIFHDPAREDGAHRRLKLARFLARWPDEGRVARIRLDPESLPSSAEPQRPSGFSAADYARHVARVRATLRRTRGGFSIVVQPPFVVVGDEPAQRVRTRARTTVGWAVQRLKQGFFSRDPERILTVWLFKDMESYVHHTRLLFGRRPSTPYGFYSRHHRALVMNINTGGGTLVHELVHPFVEANFPTCPPWFNEGLGSLFEACGEDEGRIVGYLNWRLPGLQAAIRAGRTPSIARLTSLSELDFYQGDSGTHYAMSRYLCYHLQQRGLLRRFYRAFLASRRQDPTGYQTLQRVLGQRDMAAFQRRWEAQVLRLRAPR